MKYKTIFVIDGVTNGIAKIVRNNTKEGKEYFNVYTVGLKCNCDSPHVSLTKKDMLTLVDNVKNKKMTFIGITDTYDEILDEKDLINKI